MWKMAGARFESLGSWNLEDEQGLISNCEVAAEANAIVATLWSVVVACE